MLVFAFIEYLLQLAIYQLNSGDTKAAFENIRIAREAFSANFSINSKCNLCDKIVSLYTK